MRSSVLANSDECSERLESTALEDLAIVNKEENTSEWL